jgi:hypothetical protein
MFSAMSFPALLIWSPSSKKMRSGERRTLDPSCAAVRILRVRHQREEGYREQSRDMLRCEQGADGQSKRARTCRLQLLARCRRAQEVQADQPAS